MNRAMLWRCIPFGLAAWLAVVAGHRAGGAGDLPPDPYDSVRLENDVPGVRVWGPPKQPTLSLGRSDIWDRRWFGDRQPVVTLKQLRELAKVNRLAEVAASPNGTIYDVWEPHRGYLDWCVRPRLGIYRPEAGIGAKI